jgi:hypothetical protein
MSELVYESISLVDVAGEERADQVIARLVEQTGYTEAEIVAYALALYKLSVESHYRNGSTYITWIPQLRPSIEIETRRIIGIVKEDKHV